MSIKPLPPEAVETFSMQLHPKRSYSARLSKSPSQVPIVLGITPSFGSVLGTTRVVLQVTDSSGMLSAAIDNAKLSGFAIDDATHVSGYVEAHAPGAYDVTVTNTAGTSSPLTAAYTYIADIPAARFFGAIQTDAAPYEARDGARLEFFNGLYWLMGGWNPALPVAWDGQITTNEVWSSPDLVTWTLRLAHDTNPPANGAGARWRMRHTFMTFVHDGYLWVIGGDGSDPASPAVIPSDVWRSADGLTWIRVAASSPYAGVNGKYLAIPGLYAGRMHVMGGYDSGITNATAGHWSTSDGITWIQHSDMPFNRDSVTNAIVLDNKLFIIGGNDGGNADPTTRRNDTWMWDGITWTQQSLTAGWSVGEWIATSNYDGRLWVLTRKTTPDANASGLWASDDLGVTWIDQKVYPWPPSHADAICTTPSGIALSPGVTSGLGANTYLFKSLPVDPSVTMAGLAWRLWFDGGMYNPVNLVQSVYGLTSAGTSGAKAMLVNILNAGGYPLSGEINGWPTIVFDGVDDMLRYVDGAGAADILSNAAWCIAFTGKIIAAPTNTNPYLNGSLGGSADANFAIDVRSDNTVEAYQFVAGDKIAGPKTWIPGALVHIQARYDGTNISIRLGKGSWSNTLSAPSSIASSFSIGCKYNLGTNLQMELCEYAASNIAESDMTLDLVADDMHAKWGVSV